MQVTDYSFKSLKAFNMLMLPEINMFLIKSIFGCYFFKLAPLYFFILKLKIIKFIFLNEYFYSVVLKSFSLCLNIKARFYFSKLRIKGLGFRIKFISKKLYRFFFNPINFFYFHLPNSMLVKLRRRRMLLVGSSAKQLKVVFSLLLLLRRINVYRSGGLLFPRQIIFFKIGKKQI